MKADISPDDANASDIILGFAGHKRRFRPQASDDKRPYLRDIRPSQKPLGNEDRLNFRDEEEKELFGFHSLHEAGPLQFAGVHGAGYANSPIGQSDLLRASC